MKFLLYLCNYEFYSKFFSQKFYVLSAFIVRQIIIEESRIDALGLQSTDFETEEMTDHDIAEGLKVTTNSSMLQIQLFVRMLGESLCGNLNLEFTHWEDSIWNFHKRIHESDKSEDYFIAIVNYTLNYQFNVTDLQFVFIDSYYDKDLYEKENFTNYTEELMNFASSAKQYA